MNKASGAKRRAGPGAKRKAVRSQSGGVKSAVRAGGKASPRRKLGFPRKWPSWAGRNPLLRRKTGFWVPFPRSKRLAVDWARLEARLGWAGRTEPAAPCAEEGKR